MTEYNLFETITVWWHGRLQRVLFDVPFVKPGREGNKAPAWFRDVYPSWYWSYYLDDDDRPTHIWLKNYFHAADRLVKTWVERQKWTTVEAAAARVWAWTGGPRHGFPTLGSWLEAAWVKVQQDLPNLIAAIAATLAAVPGAIQQWVRINYDAAVSKVLTLWTWLQTVGARLSAFYDDTHTWIANLRQNLAGVILGVLGSTWRSLVSFDQGALSYYYNLWGSYRQTLADFVTDPLGFLYDRAEQYLLDKW